ncbi:phosphate signaling complex protein PhoU [Archaeoglobus veneficus]|uniref:Phosphate-specific transport system accessory protein PhoU n=1 Tax=Archaeoglobus veneficus (strain DSM 11195 / SNP6) TaxID=693661 RepID=F2KSB1_ARCVS|nr:phosphate signaling complex protein PhoU [Archaeoglobus veneficus]AEA46880.1 phosphate uptake regulator, PhoU [Archaeoglobus veneficus SNP6]
MRALEERLKDIKHEILEAHSLSRKAVELCLDGLRGDEEKRKKVIQIEHIIDVMNTDVDCECVSIVALFQPVAWDLRFVVSMMRISGHYERITDLTQEIAMYTIKSGFDETMTIFEKMKEAILRMFDLVGHAIETGNTANLRGELISLDDLVDRYYVESIESIVKTAKQNPDLIEDMVDMVLVARHLERVADLLSKVGSRLIFIEEGRRVWIK